MNKYFKGLSRGTFLLTFASFFSDVSTEMLYPVLPVFLTETLKAPASIVGIVEGVAQGTQYAIAGFSGWLSDKLKKRKGVALFGYLLAALSKPFIGLSAAWPQVLIGRFSDRLGAGTRSAPRDALIAASASEQNRGRAFGLEGIGDNAGAFAGPLIAILLLFYFKVNIRSIFLLALIPGLLAFLMILFVRERPIEFSAKSKLALNVRFPKVYWKYLFVTAVFGIGNSSNAFLILKMKDIGTPLIITIFIYAFFNLVAALASFPAGSLSDKWGRKGILMFSFIIFLICYVGFAQSANVLFLGFLFVLYGVYSGIFRAVGKTYVTDFVTPNVRATGIGWYNTVIGISSLIASVIGGQLWTIVNPSATFLYGAAFAFLGIIALATLI